MYWLSWQEGGEENFVTLKVVVPAEVWERVCSQRAPSSGSVLVVDN